MKNISPGRANMKLLIVGAGSIGERHARVFRQMGVPVALVDSRVDHAREVADRYGCFSCYASLGEAPSTQFDSTVIATPADTHVQIALACANAGLHLLVEKPLSTALAGTDQLTEECRRKNLTLAVAYVLRFHPTLERVRQICQKGALGRLLSFHSVCHHYLPSSRPDYKQTYYASVTGGGGVVLDLSHELNYAEWLIGPLRLSSSMLRTVPELDMPGEAIAALSLTSQEAGIPVQIDLHAADRETRRQCHIAGSQASLTADLLTGDILLHGPSGRVERFETASERDSWHRAQAEDFLDAIASGARPRCTGADGLRTLRLCLEAIARGAAATQLRGADKGA